MRGWVHCSIGDQITLQRGIDITNKNTQPGSVPVISSGGVSSFHNMPFDEGPGVVIGRKGSLGTVHWSNGPYWPHDTTLWVKDFKGNNRRFVYYFLTTLDTKSLDVGSSNPTLNRNHVHPLPTIWPPRAEQDEIAATLGALDDKIELNRRTAATLEAMARALYRSWFVDFDPVQARADGRAPAHMDPATAALFPDRFDPTGLPEGWGIASLSTMCDQIKRTVKPMEAPEDAYLHFSLPAFDDGRTARLEKGVEIKSNKLFVTHDAILFSRLNPSIPRVWWARTKGIVATPAASTEFFIAQARDAGETPWLFCLLSSREFRDEALARVTGTSNSHQRVPPKALAEIEVVLPSPEVVGVFGAMSRPWFERVHAMATENQTLAALRDTLLPRLMSGELRVGAAREVVEDVA